MRSSLLLALTLPLFLSHAAAADGTRPPQPPPAACQALRDGAAAAECRQLLNGHTVQPAVVAVCSRLSAPAMALRCLQSAVDKQYAADALEWCEKRASDGDIVQCFALTGALNNDPALPAPAPQAAAPLPSAAPPATSAAPTVLTRKPLPSPASPRGPAPEVTRRPPPSTLDRVGHDVRNVVEGPGDSWLDRVGRDVRVGAETIGETFRPTPAPPPPPPAPPPSASAIPPGPAGL